MKKRYMRFGMLGGGMDAQAYTKTLNLSGVGSDQTDYILPIMVHQGASKGSASGMDIFLDGHCAADFSDVRFTDANGVNLPYYRASYGNYELTLDSNLYVQTLVHSDGSLVSVDVANGKVYRSTDNGAHWTQIYSGTTIGLVFIDNSGNLYIRVGAKIYRSTNWTTGSPSFASVLDLSADSTSYVDEKQAAEDSNGDLYFGIYQTPNNPRIFKSTDNGANFTQIFGYTVSTLRPRNTAVAVGAIVRPATANSHLYCCTVAGTTQDAADDGTHPTWPTTAKATVTDGGVTWKEMAMQHIHGLSVDQATHYIYAGVDGAAPKLIRSIDGGTTWTVLRDNSDSDVTQIFTGSDRRLFASGAGGAQAGGFAVMKTTDDTNFTIPVPISVSTQGLKKLGNTLYLSGVTYQKNWYPIILRSTDNGDTWTTAWIGQYDYISSAFNGYFNVAKAGTPTGDENQLILWPASNNITYLPMRAYEGGSHNQAVFYVKVTSLPSAGTTINVNYGPAKATASDITIFTNRVGATPPIHRYKFSEGTGVVIADTGSAATPRNGALTAGSGAWLATKGRFSGPPYPLLRQAGAHYQFSSSLVTITDSKADATFNLVGNWTVLCWIKITTASGSPYCIFQKGQSSGTGYYGLNIDNTSVYWYVKGAGGTTVLNVGATVAPYFEDGAWHMVGICANSDSPAKVAFIVDSHKFAYNTISNGNPSQDTAKEFIIGMRDAGDRYLPGEMDDFQIYDYELTQDQIRQIYEDRPIGTGEVVIT